MRLDPQYHVKATMRCEVDVKYPYSLSLRRWVWVAILRNIQDKPKRWWQFSSQPLNWAVVASFRYISTFDMSKPSNTRPRIIYWFDFYQEKKQHLLCSQDIFLPCSKPLIVPHLTEQNLINVIEKSRLSFSDFCWFSI